jgi:hypothetical protein
VQATEDRPLPWQEFNLEQRSEIVSLALSKDLTTVATVSEAARLSGKRRKGGAVGWDIGLLRKEGTEICGSERGIEPPSD